MKKNRDRKNQAVSRGELSIFAVGDYVMGARVRWLGSTQKTMSTWTASWKIVTADKVHVYGVQNVIMGEVKDVHMVRLRCYADKDLEITACLNEMFRHTTCLNEMFRHAFRQGVFEVAWIVDISEAEDGQGFDVVN